MTVKLFGDLLGRGCMTGLAPAHDTVARSHKTLNPVTGPVGLGGRRHPKSLCARTGDGGLHTQSPPRPYPEPSRRRPPRDRVTEGGRSSAPDRRGAVAPPKRSPLTGDVRETGQGRPSRPSTVSPRSGSRAHGTRRRRARSGEGHQRVVQKAFDRSMASTDDRSGPWYDFCTRSMTEATLGASPVLPRLRTYWRGPDGPVSWCVSLRIL